MNLKNVTKEENSVVSLEIEVGKEEFTEAINKAFKKNAPKINVPGFRRGKAPKSFIEKMYGKAVFYEDAVNMTYPEAYDKAVQEAKIEPVDRADIDVKEVGEDGYTFIAKVSVKPEVTLGEYKGIKATKEKVSVTKEDIDNELSNLSKKYSRLITVTDRPAALFDNVIIDFEGFVDEVPFDGGKGENFDLKLGSGQFIPGFEEQLVGKNIDEEVKVEVTFPEEYHAEDLKGKPATFIVKIKEIKFTELPQIDDEFAKDASEFDTLEEFKKSIEEKLLQQKEDHAVAESESQLIDTIVNELKAEIPNCMIEQQIDNIVADNDQRMRMQGLDIESYLKYSGTDMATFREMFRDQATKQVKMRLALEKIVELESVVVSEEEIENEFVKLADMYKMEVEKIKTLIKSTEIAKDLAVSKAVEFVKAHAIIEEGIAAPKSTKSKAKDEAASETKAPAKKASTKKATTKKAE